MRVVLIETDAAREYWRTSQRPEVRFYLDHCPNYEHGDCVICLAPIKLMHVSALMVRTLARNRLDKWRGRKAKFA